MHATIDGDVIVYACGFAAQKPLTNNEGFIVDPLSWCLNSVKSMIERITGEVKGCTSHEIVLSGGRNYRMDIDSEYKANRREIEKPVYYYHILQYLTKNHPAVVTDGCEADDYMGWEATKNPKQVVICTIDKDLDMIPGMHYNWNTGDKYVVSEVEGYRSFYRQLLMGDAVDNIPGVPGVGKAKAAKIINELTTEQEMYEAVRSRYVATYDEELTDPLILKRGRLLWIQREPDQLWAPPSGD